MKTSRKHFDFTQCNALLFNYRFLLTMIMVSAAVFTNDAFGQTTAESSTCTNGAQITSGTCSFAVGNYSEVDANDAVAIGQNSLASGINSIAIGGEDASAIADNAHAFGLTTASGDVSFAIGAEINTVGDTTFAFGHLLKTESTNGYNMVIGIGDIGGQTRLSNDINRSIMMGVNSSEPTVFIENAGGGSGIGRVGIGTTDPDGILHLKDESNTNTELILESGSSYGNIIRFHQSGSEMGYMRQYSSGIMEIANQDEDADLRMNVNVDGTATTVLTLAGANGNFGVNTPTPGAPMDVRSTTGGDEEVIARFRVSDSSDEFFRILNRSNTTNEYAAWLEGASDEADNSSIEVTGRVLANANTGAVPVVQFSALHITPTATISRPLFQWSTNQGAFMTMDDEGNLGIGTTSPTDLLHVNGGASKPSTNTWTIVSDENLKTDISEFTDGLDVLRDINPIWFRYNGIGGLPTETLTPGVIAQEVLQVAPYMIDSAEIVIDTVTSETMPILTYNANALFYLLLNSVKELEQRTEELEELSGQVQSLSIANTELQNQYDDLSQIITACCASQSPSYRQASIPNVEPIKRQPSSLVVHPNPFLRETTVSYTITQAFSKAILLILDSSGKPVLQIPVLQKQGSVVITSEDLATGTYFCKLRVDGVNTEATRIVKIR